MSTESKRSEGEARKSREGARILQFKTSARLRRNRPIMDPLRRLETDEDRRRMQQNLAAALVIAFVLAAGMWLIEHLQTSAHITACLEAGRHNCLR